MATDPSIAILVVDDFSTMVRIARNLLKQLGFDNVDEAAGGSSALAKMREKPYDLVISDWNMEPMSGIDLLREIGPSRVSTNALHHGHGGIQFTERDCCSRCGCRQLHPEAIHPRDPPAKNTVGIFPDGSGLIKTTS